MHTNRALLSVDARNRTYRTFLQALAVDVVVGLALFVATELQDANSWGDLEWTVLSFLAVKTILVSVASFVMRRWLDSSSVPTPLPPSPQPAPADRTPGPDHLAGT